jgi:hypothetical protein
MLYLKHFSSKTKNYAFGTIKKYANKRGLLLNFALVLKKNLTSCLNYNRKNVMDRLKGNEK